MRTELLCISVSRVTFRTFVRFVLVWICRFNFFFCIGTQGEVGRLYKCFKPHPRFFFFFFFFLFCFVLFVSTDRSKVVGLVLVLLFAALWFILRGDLYFKSCLVRLRFPRLGKRELILVLFVRLFDFALV